VRYCRAGLDSGLSQNETSRQGTAVLPPPQDNSRSPTCCGNLQRTNSLFGIALLVWIVIRLFPHRSLVAGPLLLTPFACIHSHFRIMVTMSANAISTEFLESLSKPSLSLQRCAPLPYSSTSVGRSFFPFYRTHARRSWCPRTI
jgi:hypothetical protein